MKPARKFKDLTKEEQNVVKNAGRIMIVKVIFNALNYSALLLVANLVLSIANLTFFHSQALPWVGAVVLAIIAMRLMNSANKEAADIFKEKVQQVLDR